MKTTSQLRQPHKSRKQPRYEDYENLKNENNIKTNEDNLKNKEDLRNEDELKNEANLRIKTDSKNYENLKIEEIDKCHYI